MNRRTWGVGATAVLAAIGLRRQLLGRALGLPPVAYRVRVRRGVAVTMSDGVRLLADHYAPQTAVPQPAILIRTPYGRRLLNAVYAQRFAERGYHVLCQDVRGRFGSAGTFEPYVAEQADGAATIAWLARQPWCNGRVGMWGQSYVGYVQWAAAAAAPEALQAVVPAITQSDLAIGRVDGLQLDRMLRWLVQLDALDANVAGLPGWERLRRLTQAAAQDALVARGASRLPLADADLAMFDQPVPFFRTWLRHPDPADDYWAAVDFSRAVGRVTAPAHLVAGWHDIFLDGQLADYAALRANGRAPFLTIGPWTHTDPAAAAAAIREGLAWFDAHLKGKPAALARQPVRLYVMGADEWRDLPAWPPAATPTRLFLQAGGGLAATAPAADAPPSRYTYDPAEPTPHAGGALLGAGAGPVDNRALEARADVLTFTLPPLAQDFEVIGPVFADLYVRSSLAYTDFFCRLCDVWPDGRSVNVCDGLVSVSPEVGEPRVDGSLRVRVGMAATAYRFRRGHALRLQVSSGAFPRYNRNLGLGESPWRGVRMRAAAQEVFHDRERPSALVLPA